MSPQNLISPHPKWGKKPTKDLGIVASGDHAVEWILPFFEKFVSKSNLPVTFFDQGLTPGGLAFAKDHFDVIPFHLDTSFVYEHPNAKARWDLIFSEDYLSKRHAWFHKPFLLLNSPYKRTLWLDIDCKVQRPLDSFLNNFAPCGGFAVAPDFLPEGASRENTSRNVLCANNPGETVYNTGVLFVEHGSPFLEEWAQVCLHHNGIHIGDQDALVDLCFHKKLEKTLLPHLPDTFSELPKTFNWNHLVSENKEAYIIHYHSIGKEKIHTIMDNHNLHNPHLQSPHMQMFLS